MPFSIKQDLHCHSNLSNCCADPMLTPENIYAHALGHGYKELCLTDHLWSEKVYGASGWYAPQNTAHGRRALPLPQTGALRFRFGCEAEYLGGSHLAIADSDFELYDFVVIPINHFHMEGFVRPAEVQGIRETADLLTTRLEELTRLELPWRKIGIAHLTCPLMYQGGNVADVVMAMNEVSLRKSFQFLAEHGAGIELNADAFHGWQEFREGFLRLYQIARDEGCKFYCASDAHTVAALDSIQEYLPGLIHALGLDRAQQYHIPM